MSKQQNVNDMIPNWDNYLLTQAFVVAQRSPDLQTKCGCILANKNHQIVGQGYNGFPRGLNDKLLPKTRPEKYDWMIHAEVNSIVNSNSKLDDCTAYITTKPCFNCVLLLWQSGIKNIVYASNGHIPSMLRSDDKYELLIEDFTSMSNINFKEMQVNGNFLRNVLDTLADKRYNN